MTENIFRLSDRYVNARDYADECKKQSKEADAELEELEQQLMEAMLSEDCKKFERNGVTFSHVATPYHSPDPMHKDQVYDLMKRNGYASEFSINPQRFNGLMNELKSNHEGNLPNWLEGLIKQYDKTYIRLTGKAKRGE